jgi:hypothetical protein
MAMGKPAGQCFKEAVGLNSVSKEVVEKDLTRQVDQLPEGEPGSRVNKVKLVSKIVGKASGPLNALGVVKCMMWDMPES